MKSNPQLEVELDKIVEVLQARSGQRIARDLLMDALLIAIAQTNPELFARVDQNFRHMVEGKRQQLEADDSPVTMRTFESNVEELLRQMVLLR